LIGYFLMKLHKSSDSAWPSVHDLGLIGSSQGATTLNKKDMDYQPIENYGIIGDLKTIALVGLNGSINFMCFPDFDSPSLSLI
jgi:hypothetical protein